LEKKTAILIPVHNRKFITLNILQELESQFNIDKCTIFLIDCGSQDGTTIAIAQFIQTSKMEVSIINGHHSWWWGRAIAEGLKASEVRKNEYSHIIMMNDDIHLSRNLFRIKEEVNLSNPKAIYFANLYIYEGDKLEFWESGIEINYKKFLILPGQKILESNPNCIRLASGRFIVYPTEFFDRIDINRIIKFTPHHYADLTLCLKALALGYEITPIPGEFVLSENIFGSTRIEQSIFKRYFHKGSASRILSQIYFWIQVLKFRFNSSSN
jgi:GT2 family glycosyltransferase